MKDMLNNNVCAENMCAGCGVCLCVCKKDAITLVDKISAISAEINTDKCVKCGSCHNICPMNNPPTKNTQLSHYQGWAKDEETRKKGASGGIASAIMKKFLMEGGYVAACTFQNGEFCFKVDNNIESYKSFRGSKYVKSSPQTVYSQIKECVKKKNKLLFIGLPCQVAAVKNFLNCEEQEYLYTIDLICHGTPSPKCLDLYLSEK